MRFKIRQAEFNKVSNTVRKFIEKAKKIQEFPPLKMTFFFNLSK